MGAGRLALPAALSGLGVLYVGERALHEGWRYGVSGFGLALMVAASALALWRVVRADSTKKVAARYLLLGFCALWLPLGIYLAQLPELAWLHGKAQVVATVVWPTLLVLFLLPLFLAEMAYRSVAKAPTLEIWRLSLSAKSALVVALSWVIFAALNYSASQWNRKVDLSYFKTSQAGTSTRALVESLSQTVRVVLFFPPGNEVLEQARAYFGPLEKLNSKFRLEVVDQALEPDLARDAKVRGNGHVAILGDGRNETLRLGLDVEDARGALKGLDQEFQEKLLRIVRPARVAYLTTGHFERDFAPPADDQRLSLGDFKQLLEGQGFTIKRLGLAEGLGTQIPDDAALIVVAGPTAEFLPAERASLQTYLNRAGKLLVFVDPDQGTSEDELLAPLGVRVSKNLVAHERYLVQIEGRGESRYNVATMQAANHPSVQTFNNNNGRLYAVLLGSGAVHKLEPAPAELKIVPTLKAMPESWEDTNKNGKFDKDSEKRVPLDFGVAIEKDIEGQPTPMRALVYGDADMAGSMIVRNPGNAYVLLDSIKWLVGDENWVGEIESEKDVPIVHKKDADTVIFYGTSFLIPALVLGAGLFYSRRTQRFTTKGTRS